MNFLASVHKTIANATIAEELLAGFLGIYRDLGLSSSVK